MTIVMDTALRCAARGWHVFPLNGKVPLPNTRAFYDATTDPELIRALWTREWNLGIATGAVSGIWVLDIDTSDEKPGMSTMVNLAGRFTIPKTLTIRTGSGGLHLYFRHPGRKVKTCKNVLPGVDVRGDGGYVVAPPSIHPDTRMEYSVARRLPVADTPAWLTELVVAPPPPPPRPPAPPRALPRASARVEQLHRLKTDPATRERAGLALGASIIGDPGMRRAKGVRCPQCGRPSVYWFIDPHRLLKAKCDHEKSCGWMDDVASLLGF